MNFPVQNWLSCVYHSLGSRVGGVARALASHQCVLGSIPGPGVIRGLSLLLALYSAPSGFSPSTSVFPSPQKSTFPNSNSILECTDISERVFVNCLMLRGYTNYIFTCLDLHTSSKLVTLWVNCINKSQVPLNIKGPSNKLSHNRC